MALKAEQIPVETGQYLTQVVGGLPSLLGRFTIDGAAASGPVPRACLASPRAPPQWTSVVGVG